MEKRVRPPRSHRQLLQVLRERGLFPRKGLGQHFLIETRVLRHIIAAADLSPQDVVIEVGPGLGILTERLSRRARKVIAVELDAGLADWLRTAFSEEPRVQIVEGDILTLDPFELTEGSEYKVVANLPYYITSPVLRHFLHRPARPCLMVLMVQREVAQNIAASPGKMGLLSVLVQFYAVPQIVTYVPASCFYPPPKVDSAVLKLQVRETPAVAVPDPESFFTLVTAGFAAPRKQLHNSLSQGLGVSSEEVAAKLTALGIDFKRRPQTLTLEEWAKIWEIFQGDHSR